MDHGLYVQVSSIGNQPTLEYDVTDTAGASMRVTVLSGTVVLQQETASFIVNNSDFFEEVPQGLFLPAAPPLPAGPDPIIVAEMSVSYFWPSAKGTEPHGVSKIHAQVQPNPQQGGQRGVYLSFFMIGGQYLGLRYRVTLFRPRP